MSTDELMTLYDYVTEVMEYYKIPDTKKNLRKIKKKFERKLVEDGIWIRESKTDKQKEGKQVSNEVKIFSRTDLDKITAKFEDYLLDRSKYDKDFHIEAEYRLAEEYPIYSGSVDSLSEKSEEERNREIEVLKQMSEKVQLNEKSVSEENAGEYADKYIEKELPNIMLKAIFEKFFTPIDTIQWREDIINDRVATESFYSLKEKWNNLTDDEAFARRERLNSYNKQAYYSEKK